MLDPELSRRHDSLLAKPVTPRRCYVCQRDGNPIVASEPIQHRFGKSVLPEDTYRFARCRRCATLYVDSDVSDEYLHDMYALESEESVAEVLGGQGHDDVLAPRLPEFRLHWAQMKRQRPVRTGDQLLDFGCQTGEFGSLALADGVRPNGIELSMSYAATARANWGAQSLVYSGELSKAPFSDSQFAYISAFETLEHMCDPVTALSRLRRWLTADGILGLSVPSSDYFHLKYWVFTSWPVTRFLLPRLQPGEGSRRAILPHTHIYNFSHRSLRMLLERAGLEPVCVAVTGWHGRLAPSMGPASQLIERLSGRRIGLAPSLFAIARPKDR